MPLWPFHMCLHSVIWHPDYSDTLTIPTPWLFRHAFSSSARWIRQVSLLYNAQAKASTNFPPELILLQYRICENRESLFPYILAIFALHEHKWLKLQTICFIGRSCQPKPRMVFWRSGEESVSLGTWCGLTVGGPCLMNRLTKVTFMP